MRCTSFAPKARRTSCSRANDIACLAHDRRKLFGAFFCASTVQVPLPCLSAEERQDAQLSKTFTSGSSGFSIRYPEKWTIAFVCLLATRSAAVTLSQVLCACTAAGLIDQAMQAKSCVLANKSTPPRQHQERALSIFWKPDAQPAQCLSACSLRIHCIHQCRLSLIVSAAPD